MPRSMTMETTAAAEPAAIATSAEPVGESPIKITYFQGYGRADPIRFML